MLKKYFILVICLLANISSSQTSKIDSLKLELKKNKSDKFLDYKNLTLQYINSNDVQNTKKYSKIALDYATNKNNYSYIASAKILDSWNYIFISDFDNAIKILDDAFKYAKKAGDNKTQLYLHQNKLFIFQFKTDFKSVLLESEKAILLIGKIKTDKEIKNDLIGLLLQKSIAYTELGMFDFAKKEIINAKKEAKNDILFIPSILMSEYQLYGKMKDFKNAIKACEKILLFSEQNNYHNKVGTLLATYYNLAVYYNQEKNIIKSNHFLDVALNFKEDTHFFANYKTLKPYFFDLRSKNFVIEKSYEQALVSVDSAIFYSKINKEDKILANSFNQKANVLFNQKKYYDAIKYNEKAKIILNKIGLKTEEADVLEELIKLYSLTNQSNKVINELKNYTSIKNQIFNEDIAKSITATEIRYETELKESKIKTQQLQIEKEKTNKNIALSSIGLLLLLGLGGFWFYRSKQNQTNLKTQNTLLGLQQNLIEAELSNLNKQLDPHEIKNLLAHISPEIQDKAPESYKKMLKLFNLTKASLNSNSITDTIENQVKQIDDFLSLEKSMSSIPLEYSIENSIENTQTEIPRMLLKNLVENAIKHGIKQKETGGSITIVVKEKDSFIYISVDDTGKGRQHAISLDSGIGTTTYQKLFATLNPKNKENATFEIIDKEQGTKVEVKIPTNYKYS